MTNLEKIQGTNDQTQKLINKKNRIASTDREPAKSLKKQNPRAVRRGG